VSVSADPQTSIYETEIEDENVERLLEARDKAKASARAVNKKARDADSAAKAALEALDLGHDATVRIGRFLVTLKKTESRSVSFDTAPGERWSIKQLPSE
jgi:hypothetical protein